MPTQVLRTPLAIALWLGSGLFIVMAGMRYMAELLAPILLAYSFAVALLPTVKRLEHRGLPRPFAVAGVFLTAFLVAALLIAFFTLELQQFARRIPVYQGMLEDRLAQLEAVAGRWGYQLSDLRASTQMVPANLTRVTLSLVSRLLSATSSLILFLFILLTMTLDIPSIGRAFYRHGRDQGALSRQVSSLFGETQTYFHLQTISNLISAVAVTAAYLLFRIDFALLWGLLTFFMSYIPRIGMLLSFIPAVLMAVVQYGLERALLLFLVSIVLNGLMDNFIAPTLSKKGLALRSSTVLLASLLWMWIFGPLGALLAMPMTLLFRKLLESNEQTFPLAYAISTDDYEPSSAQDEAA